MCLVEGKRARPQAAEVRRAQIVQAALDIVGEKGLDGLTTAGIAQRVGVAEATIFKHFDSKLEILRAVTRTFHARLQTVVEGITQRDAPASRKLGELLRRHLETLQQNPGLPRMIFAEHLHLHDDVVGETIRQSLDRVRQVVSEIVAQGVAEGSFRGDLDIAMVATCYVGLVQATIIRWVMDGGSRPLDDEARRVAEFLVGCLTHPVGTGMDED